MKVHHGQYTCIVHAQCTCKCTYMYLSVTRRKIACYLHVHVFVPLTVPEFHCEWRVSIASFSIDRSHWLYSAVTGSVGWARGGVGGGVNSWPWLPYWNWRPRWHRTRGENTCTCVHVYNTLHCVTPKEFHQKWEMGEVPGYFDPFTSKDQQCHNVI